MPKDACYHKVKSRYRVFPSAYASGAIAKCRKVGAANYGKSAKKKATGGVVKMKKGGEAKKTKNLGDKIEKYGNTAINTLTGMALGAGAYGLNLARTARSKAEKAAKQRFNNYIADLDKKRVKKSLKKKGFKFSGGGAGGGSFGQFSTIGRTKKMAKDMPDMKFFSKGGFIAKGCGQVENSRRKRTRTF